jgi:CheY-like chemotaxis protein
MNCRDGQKQLTGCLVLLVDDHKDFLEAIRLFLSFSGADVSAATAGQKGLDLVVKDQPEIIISDLTMTKDERV